MSKQFSNSEEFLRKLNNLFNGLMALPLLMVGFGYLEITSGYWQGIMEPDNPVLVSTILGIGGLATYLSLRFQRESRGLTALATLPEKMTAYYKLASFYYWSAFALSIVAIALLFIFADVAYAVVYAFILFWMSIFRPTLRNLVDLFDLHEEEKEKFLNKETIK